MQPEELTTVAVDAAALEGVRGSVLVSCPVPGCDVSLGSDTIGASMTHHPDGSHTLDPGALVSIRLLTSVQGDGPVYGDTGAVLEVPEAVADVWADGERAERVVVEAVAPRRGRGRAAKRP